jgi:hypothetical protein
VTVLRPIGAIRRDLAWGAAAAALYVAVIVTFGSPGVRHLLYDGLLPIPPYQWVRAPGAHADTNPPPASATGTLALGPAGSAAAEVSTADQQATVTFPRGAVPPQAGETAVRVTITPLDAGTLAPAPRGRRFDSNAYRIEAAYAGSGAPVTLARPVDVVLEYAAAANVVMQLQDRAWTVLKTVIYSGSQEVLTHTDRLGTFVASP